MRPILVALFLLCFASIAEAQCSNNDLWRLNTSTKLWECVTPSKSLVGLTDADNTADTAKPVSSAQQSALNAKTNVLSWMVFATTTAPACSNGGGTTTFLGSSGAGSTTETSVVRFVVPMAGTVKNLYVWLGGNVPASESAEVKVVKTGSAQATPIVTIAAGAASGNDTSNSFTVVAGDQLNVQVRCSGGTTALNARASVSFTILQ